MGNNYHTPWEANTTQFTATSMNPALADLDKGITYGTKKPIIACAGRITWSGGTLTWDATIQIFFIRADGKAILNTIAAGNIAIADNEFCYVDLNETDNTALTMSKASISTGSASNFLTLGRLVMAYRNATNDALYSVYLPRKYSDPIDSSENVILSGGAVGTSAVKVVALGACTKPTSFPTDVVQIGAYDQAAGNCCPHIWTENGSEIKIYKESALTSQLTTLTYTEPSTPDYAIQDLTQTTPYGFASKDEGNSVLKVIANLQTRLEELESRLKNHGLIS